MYCNKNLYLTTWTWHVLLWIWSSQLFKDSPKTEWSLLKRSCTNFSNARTVLTKYQLLKCLFFAAPQKYFSCQSTGICYLLAMSIYQVHLVSTELVFPDKCFAIFFVSFEFILPCFYGFYFYYFTGIFNIWRVPCVRCNLCPSPIRKCFSFLIYFC